MVDIYASYKAMFMAAPTELACLAYIRSKFFDVHAASGSPVADEALRRIAQLENESGDESPNVVA